MKSISYFTYSVFSGLTFVIALLLNRIIFLLENKDFVLNQANATVKWFEIANPLVNVVTIFPLIAAIVFGILSFLLEKGKITYE